MNDNLYIEDSEHRLTLRNLELADYKHLKKIMDIVYPDMGGAWPEKKFRAQLSAFPEGQICISDHGEVVAAAFSLIVDYDKFGDHHTYDEITGDAYLTTHDPMGDVLYGAEVVVHPDYQGMRLGRRLYEARKELCRNLNLKSIVAGGRIPNYQRIKSLRAMLLYLSGPTFITTNNSLLSLAPSRNLQELVAYNGR